VALVVPNREAVAAHLVHRGHTPGTAGANAAVVRLLESEIDAWRAGGKHGGTFPERWLPSRIGVVEEPFTEQNGLVNSTMKLVRGKIEARYKDLLAELHR
jgi:long-chain acyl-CoA synthetase